MRRVFMVAGAPPPPAPDFAALEVDHARPGARLVPAGGRVSVNGEEWGFRDIGAIVLLSNGEPWPATITGSAPTMITPCRIAPDFKITVSIGGPSSVIETTEDRPVVLTGLGTAKWGEA